MPDTPVKEKNKDHLVSYLNGMIQSMVNHRGSSGANKELAYCRDIDLQCANYDSEDPEVQLAQSSEGVTVRKVQDGLSWFIDLVGNNLDQLFVLNPTSVPDLSKKDTDKVLNSLEKLIEGMTNQNIQHVLQQVQQGYAQSGLDITMEQAQQLAVATGVNFMPTKKEITEAAKSLKGVAREKIKNRAGQAAKGMKRAIIDIHQETKYKDQMLKVISDYFTYPYCIMATDDLIPVSRRVWKGNKFEYENQTLCGSRRVNPFDFYWSSDSTDPHDGSACGEALKLRKGDLLEIRKNETNTVIKQQITSLLDECSQPTDLFNWLDIGDRERDLYFDFGDQFIHAFSYHGLVTTKHLNSINVYPDNDRIQHEISALVVGEYLLKFEIHDLHHTRPYAKDSFKNKSGRFYGRSLPEILRPLEKKYRATSVAIVRNLAWSSAPYHTTDISQFESEECVPVNGPEPGGNYFTRSRPGATNKPIEAHVTLNNTPQMRQFLFDTDEKADLFSGFPRFAMGQTGNLPSSLRSASMMSMMLTNATKIIKTHMMLFGQNIIIPTVDRKFEWLMVNSKDESIKGDASLAMAGPEGIILKDFSAGQIKDALQYLAPFEKEKVLEPGTIRKLLYQYIQETGIDISIADPANDDELAFATNSVNVPSEASPQPQLDGRSQINIPSGQALAA